MRLVRLALIALVVSLVSACGLQDRPHDSSNHSRTAEPEQPRCATHEGAVTLPQGSSQVASAVEERSCLVIEGNLSVRGEIDNLPTLQQIDELQVTGRVVVDTDSGLEDLSALEPLTEVGASLVIEANGDLASTRGLANLAHVGGDLRIADNPALTRVAGFGSLRQIASDLRILENPKLREVTGFGRLTYIAEYSDPQDRPDPAGEDDTGGGANHTDPSFRPGVTDPHIVVTDNPALETIDGFASLTDIDGDIRLRHNPRLKHIGGFGQLEFMTGELLVVDAPRLSDIDALVRTSCLQTVRLEKTGVTDLGALSTLWELGALELVDNPKLADVGPLSEQLRLHGPIVVDNNDSLDSIAGLGSPEVIDREEYRDFEMPTAYRDTANVKCVPMVENRAGEDRRIEGSVRIVENDSLQRLGQLAWREVGGTLRIAENDELTSLEGLSELRTAEQSIEIIGNDSLRRLESFDRLGLLEGDLAIAEHDNLETLRGFALIADIRGNLRIADNPALESIDGFDNLDHAGDVTLRDNSATDLDAFARLEYIDSLEIAENSSLAHLEDFVSLKQVRGTFRITDNPKLTRLDRFDALEEIEDGLIVQDNPKLPSCEVDALTGSAEMSYALVEDNASCQ